MVIGGKEFSQAERGEVLRRIATELEALEKEAAKIGEGMLAYILAMARHEAGQAVNRR